MKTTGPSPIGKLGVIPLLASWWFLQVELSHGHHEYRFLVDGKPVLDPHAAGVRAVPLAANDSRRLQSFGRRQSDQLVHDFTALEEDKRRHALDFETLSQGGRLIDVDFDKLIDPR
jgi:hypothetical protein